MTVETGRSKDSASAIQRLLPHLSQNEYGKLPTTLHKDRFSGSIELGGAALDGLTTAGRIYNMHLASGTNPTIISGRAGIGKSVLSWQIMAEAEGHGKCSMMISAATLVMQRNIEAPSSGGTRLPHSNFETLEKTLAILTRSENRHLASNLLLVVDGVDVDSGGYSPSLQNTGVRSMLQRMGELGVSVILNVDSREGQLRTGLIESYARLLNPSGAATVGIRLLSDISGRGFLSREDITHSWSEYGQQQLNVLRLPR